MQMIHLQKYSFFSFFHFFFFFRALFVCFSLCNNKFKKVFEAFSKGVHRVLVTKDGKPLNILTQSDVLKFLNKNIDTLKDVDLPILKTGLFRELKVLSLNHHKPAVHGFSLMVMHEVKAIPILDEYFFFIIFFFFFFSALTYFFLFLPLIKAMKNLSQLSVAVI